MIKERFAIGHLLVKVPDLHTAVRQYEDYGFTVTYGAAPEKATNAMIYFADGSFVELFSMQRFERMSGYVRSLLLWLAERRDRNIGARIRYYYAANEGLCDYALDSEKGAFAKNIADLAAEGLQVGRALPFRRVDAMGRRLNWHLCSTGERLIPFFMSEYEPYHPPLPEQCRHRNGSRSIRSLWIEAVQPDSLLPAYRLLFRETASAGEREPRSGVTGHHFTSQGKSIVLSPGPADRIVKAVLDSGFEIG